MKPSVDTRFNQGLALAQNCGIQIRFDYLQGRGGGICQIDQRPNLFVDLALDPEDQLRALEQALQVVVREDWPLPDRDKLARWLTETG